MKMTRMDRVFKGIECCSAAVRCDQCPYNKHDRKECMKELMLDVCIEIGMEVPEAWKDEDY